MSPSMYGRHEWVLVYVCNIYSGCAWVCACVLHLVNIHVVVCGIHTIWSHVICMCLMCLLCVVCVYMWCVHVVGLGMHLVSFTLSIYIHTCVRYKCMWFVRAYLCVVCEGACARG